MSSNRRLPILALVAMICLSLTGCGGGGSHFFNHPKPTRAHVHRSSHGHVEHAALYHAHQPGARGPAPYRKGSHRLGFRQLSSHSGFFSELVTVHHVEQISQAPEFQEFSRHRIRTLVAGLFDGV